MGETIDPGRWVAELASAGDTLRAHRPDEQLAAIQAALRRRQVRRVLSTAAGTAALVAAGLSLWCTPRAAQSTAANVGRSAAAAWAEGPAEAVARARSPRRAPAAGRRPPDATADAASGLDAAAPSPPDAAPSDDPDPEGSEPADRPRTRAERPHRARPPNARPGDTAPIVVPRWRALLDGGDPAGALAAMDPAAFEAFAAAASADELWRVAQAARTARDGAHARAALRTIRKRFADHERAEPATFVLGRVAAELSADPKRAAQWYARYVDEYPDGALAGQARGRVLGYHAESGSPADARAAARDYLDHHPTGPYADLARATLD
ncbi:MAG: hypothetical protein AAF721_29190 [Myxococcota bacterium]